MTGTGAGFTAGFFPDAGFAVSRRAAESGFTAGFRPTGGFAGAAALTGALGRDGEATTFARGITGFTGVLETGFATGAFGAGFATGFTEAAGGLPTAPDFPRGSAATPSRTRPAAPPVSSKIIISPVFTPKN